MFTLNSIFFNNYASYTMAYQRLFCFIFLLINVLCKKTATDYICRCLIFCGAKYLDIELFYEGFERIVRFAVHAEILIHMNKVILFFLTLALLVCCSSPKEATMPFRNMGYSGERLFPVQQSDGEKMFRVWFNNGTSIDRVITVSFDSIFENQCYFAEFGVLFRNQLFKEKRIFINTNIPTKPRSGIDVFFEKIDSLNLFTYKNQETFYYPMHKPFSLYVVEVKDGNKYNQFRFNSYFPYSVEDSTQYGRLELLILDEFKFNFHIK